MSERTTGATDAQIADGFQRYADAHPLWSDEGRYGWRIEFTRQANRVLPWIVPTDYRIIGPEDIAAIRTLTEFIPTIRRLGLPAHVNHASDRLAALIGESNG